MAQAVETQEFVPHHLALKLKELGFDKPCIAWYLTDEPTEPLPYPVVSFEFKNFNTDADRMSIPLWQQAFDWFREKFNYHHSIQSYHCVNKELPFGVFIDYEMNGSWGYYEYSGKGDFQTYEEAREAALKYLIGLKQSK